MVMLQGFPVFGAVAHSLRFGLLQTLVGINFSRFIYQVLTYSTALESDVWWNYTTTKLL
jgi:hypothetical protein